MKLKKYVIISLFLILASFFVIGGKVIIKDTGLDILQDLEVDGSIHAIGDICTEQGGVVCLSSGGGLWTQSDSDVYYNTGNVGIGTTSPSAKLDVDGDIKLGGSIRARSSTQITNTQWFNCASGCSGDVKLHTPIYHKESNMFMIKIRGYGYGTGGRNKEIICSGYAYSGSTLIAEACNTIVGSTTATITTVNRDGSTYVVIVLNNGAGYYNHYTWEYIGWTAHDPDDFYWEP